MEFKNSNRLSNKELLVLKDQKQLNELKTQIEKDTELKNRFVDHYLKYMERSRNEQSKKYVTDIFFKAIKALSILSPDQERSLTTKNLKETLISLKNPSTLKQKAENEKDQSEADRGFGDNEEDIVGTPVEEVKKSDPTIAKTGTKIELPNGAEINSFMSSLSIDITKPLSIDSTIDFNGFMRKAYEGITKIKEVSAKIRTQNTDELFQKISQLDNTFMDQNGIDGLMKITSDIVKILPGNMGKEIEQRLPDFIQQIKSDPDSLKGFKQTMVAGITLCKNGFIDAVCDELLAGGMELYTSLPVITPESINDPKSQQEFIQAALKIAQLLKSSLMKGYNAAKNSTITHSSEVMSQLQTQFLGKLDQIPDTLDFNDPKVKENIKKGYYQIITMFNKITGGKSFEIDSNGMTIESGVVSNIAEQQLQLFNKCKSLKFGIFGKKIYEVTNPDGSVFRINKEKQGYHIAYEKPPQLCTITLDQQGKIVNYLSFKKDIMSNSRSDSPLGQDPTHDQESLKLLLDGCKNIR